MGRNRQRCSQSVLQNRACYLFALGMCKGSTVCLGYYYRHLSLVDLNMDLIKCRIHTHNLYVCQRTLVGEDKKELGSTDSCPNTVAVNRIRSTLNLGHLSGPLRAVLTLADIFCNKILEGSSLDSRAVTNVSPYLQLLNSIGQWQRSWVLYEKNSCGAILTRCMLSIGVLSTSFLPSSS